MQRLLGSARKTDLWGLSVWVGGGVGAALFGLTGLSNGVGPVRKSVGNKHGQHSPSIADVLQGCAWRVHVTLTLTDLSIFQMLRKCAQAAQRNVSNPTARVLSNIYKTPFPHLTLHLQKYQAAQVTALALLRTSSMITNQYFITNRA